VLRQSLNVYLSSFLSLAKDQNVARLILIREAISADSLRELIQEWAWIQDLDQNSALKLKLWFQLTYTELAEVFGITAREVSQLIRNQRVAMLPNYRPEGGTSGEFSCFMLEQHLSPWMDGEVRDTKTIESIFSHTQKCFECRKRLEGFRNLQSSLLDSRIQTEEIAEAEWSEALRILQRERASQRNRIVLIGISLILLSLFIAWAIFSKPDKMPNIYEITR
jgi:hypothetical protein